MRGLRAGSSGGPSGDRQGLSEKQKLSYNVIGLLSFLALVFILINWMLSDVTGEYTASDRVGEPVRLSIVRRAANVHSELSYGSGAYLETTVNEIDPAKGIHLVFDLPDEWVQKGQQFRRVTMEGKFDEGDIDATFMEGQEIFSIKLKRQPINSVYRQIQSHLPWL